MYGASLDDAVSGHADDLGGAGGGGLHQGAEGVIMEEFSSRLQRLRERQRKKKYVMSELCGISQSSLRRYERGEMEPSAKALVAIADYFGVSVDYLLGRTENPNINK